MQSYCKGYSIPFLVTITDKSKAVVYENVDLTKSLRKAIYDESYYQIALSPKDAVQLIISTDHSTTHAATTPTTENVVGLPSSTSTSTGTTPNRNSNSFTTYSNLSITYALASGKPAHNTRKRIEVGHSTIPTLLNPFFLRVKFNQFYNILMQKQKLKHSQQNYLPKSSPS